MRRAGGRLPRVEESTYYGTPALKVDGEMLACIASHSSAEPGTLVVRIPIADRDALIAEAPDTYYLTDHYVGYASVLVRLSRIREDALRDLLAIAWKFVTSMRAKKRTRPRASRYS